jgi:hypothetical protein
MELTDSGALEDDPVSGEIIQSRNLQGALHVAQKKSSLLVHLPTNGKVVPIFLHIFIKVRVCTFVH